MATGRPFRRDAAHSARRGTQIALATMLLLLVVLGGVAIFSMDRLYRTADDHYVKEAFPLRESSRDLVLQMLNEETGVRGYLITGDRGSLEPYLQARPRVRQDLASLATLTERLPEIGDDVASVRQAIAALDKYFAGQIAQVASGPQGQQSAQTDVLAGKRRFDSFRLRAGALLNRSDEIVRAAEHSQTRTFRGTLAFVIAAGLAIAIIGIGLLLVLPERLKQLYEREQDARRLAERGDQASRALANVTDAVVLLDEDGVVRYWNPAAATLAGLSEDAALNRPGVDVIPDFAAIEQALSDGGAGLAPVRAGGDERWVAVSERRFDEGRVIVLRDVTAENRLERARSEFLATASHELRTPLAAVYGAVRTLRRSDRPDDPALETRLLVMIEEESERLGAIIDQILVSAQLDRDEIYLNQRATDVGELCVSVVDSARQRASAGIDLEVEAPSGVFAECDPERLRQVLSNLVENAIKYSPAGGLVQVSLSQMDGVVRVDVRDGGIGIAADDQARIFEKFFRADPDMLAGVGGSGLGLYISRELMSRMGGSISVRSQLGAGSTFSVKLRAPSVR